MTKEYVLPQVNPPYNSFCSHGLDSQTIAAAGGLRLVQLLQLQEQPCIFMVDRQEVQNMHQSEMIGQRCRVDNLGS